MLKKPYFISRLLIGLMALVMLAATLPAYGNPTSNPGLINLSGAALSLGETAGAFLGRQMTVVIIALIGAFTGIRHLVMIGGFGMMFMNGHDAVLMGTLGGSDMRVAAVAGLVFALLGALAVYLAWRKPA
jgi:hypothetical protein